MTQAASSNSSQANLSAKLSYESMSLLAKQGQSSIFVSIANAVIVYLFLLPLSESNFLKIWLAVVISVSVSRFIVIRLFFNLEEDSPRLKLWLTAYLFLICISALTWGVLPLTEYFRATSQSFAFIIFVLAGMSAGALVSLYARLDASIPYLALILFPLIFSLSIGSAGQQLEMAILAGLYLVMLVRSSYSLNASAKKTLLLEVQNSELFDFLLNSNRYDNDRIPSSDTYEI